MALSLALALGTGCSLGLLPLRLTLAPLAPFMADLALALE